MKLKTFFSPDMPTAMNEIREHLGEDAIVVSAHRIENKGIKLIVATEGKQVEADDKQNLKNKERFNYFQKALQLHDLPESFIERLVQNTQRKSGKATDERLLAAAFNELFSFCSVYPPQNNRVYVLVGNAGSGKTRCAVKMAFQAQKAKLKPALVTLDTVKIGGSTELETVAKMMKIPCTIVRDIKDLNETITIIRLSANYIIVDVPAFNPYLSTHLEKLKSIKQQLSDAEMILTMPAGLNTQESITQGSLFAKSGCSSLIATKLDCARTYGNLLQTTLHNQLNWAGLSISDKISDALFETTPSTLSHILLTQNLSENKENS